MSFASPGYLSDIFVIQNFPVQLNCTEMMLYNSSLHWELDAVYFLLNIINDNICEF